MNLSTLTKEWDAEKSSGAYIKTKAIKGIGAVKGATGTRYNQTTKNEALNLLQSKSFKSVQEITGIADSTLRYWYKAAHPSALVA